MQFLVDILPLGSGSVDPHIFADPDPDPGGQNLADPTDPDPDTDPDPKHWIYLNQLQQTDSMSLTLRDVYPPLRSILRDL